MKTDIYSLTAGDLMTSHVDTISENASLQSAIEMMVGLEISALPVVEAGGKCVGVITKTDVIRFVGGGQAVDAIECLPTADRGDGPQDMEATPVSALMTRHVLAASIHDLIPTVAEKMLLHEVHHVPVCDPEDKVLGVISAMDLVKAIQVTAAHAAACRSV